MNHFLSETGNKVQAHKGVFWLIEDKLLTFPFEKNRYQSSVSKSGDTYVHKYLWKEISNSKVSYNFYPRGRVEIKKCGSSIVYMNPNIAEEYVKQIMDDFGLYEYPKIIYDNSLHYKCYLDDGWRAE